MKRVFLCLICAALLLSACAPLQPAALPEPAEPTQEPQYTPSTHELVWKVEPMFEYEVVAHCFLCGFFTRPEFRLLDESTGQTAGLKDGHGGAILSLYHDPELDLFGRFAGMHIPSLETFTRDEFLSAAPHLADRFNLFHGFDSTRVVVSGGDPPVYDFSDALTGAVALAIGTDLIGWYEFDDDEWLATVDRGLGIVAVREGEFWGIMDSNGNIVAPFVFEHAIAIDNYTAFAKYGGLYGILQVREAGGDVLPGVGIPLSEVPPPVEPVRTFDMALAEIPASELVTDNRGDYRLPPLTNLHLLDAWVENYRMGIPGRVAVLIYGGPFPSGLIILESDGSANYRITEYNSASRPSDTEQQPPQTFGSNVVIVRYYDYIFGSDIPAWRPGSEFREGPVHIRRSGRYNDADAIDLRWNPQTDAPLAGITPQQAEERAVELSLQRGWRLAHGVYSRTVRAIRLGENTYYVVFFGDLETLNRGEHGGHVTAISLDGRLAFIQSMVDGEWIFADDAQQEIIAPYR